MYGNRLTRWEYISQLVSSLLKETERESDSGNPDSSVGYCLLSCLYNRWAAFRIYSKFRRHCIMGPLLGLGKFLSFFQFQNEFQNDFSLVFWAALVLELVSIHFCYFWALSSLVSPWPHTNVEPQIFPSHHIQMKSIVLRIAQKVNNSNSFLEITM